MSSVAGQIPTRINIVASFTADPVVRVVEFWGRTFSVELTANVAPYGQVFQTLLSPGGLLDVEPGFSCIIVDEDWFFSDKTKGPAETASELLRAVDALLSRRRQNPALLCCPSRESRLEALRPAFANMRAECPALSVITAEEIGRLYPVGMPFLGSAHEHGDLRYSPEYFTAMGTYLVREMLRLHRKQHKVFAMDCDNTLWRGVVGEDGPEKLEYSRGNLAIQKRALEQAKNGVLLAICTKNNEADVMPMFEGARSEQLVRASDLSGRAIGWIPKSELLKTLAVELNLGLDSFVFVDDNPMECSEVAANLPSVRVLNIPTEESALELYADHMWLFDTVAGTKEDAARTAFYQANTERDALLCSSDSFLEFLKTLQLRVDISDLTAENLPRISQLTKRTNQFNSTKVERDEQAVGVFIEEGGECSVVRAADRFGDYGIIGTTFSRPGEDALNVEAFLLSCRALGKGVEHRILASLASRAIALGLAKVRVAYRDTGRNAPFRDFITSLDLGKTVDGEMTWFEGEARSLSTLEFKPNPQAVQASATEAAPKAGKAVADLRDFDDLDVLNEIAVNLTSARTIADRMAQLRAPRPDLDTPFVAPKTPLAVRLASMWSEACEVKKVGVHDTIVALGGDSLSAAQILAQLGAAGLAGTGVTLTTLLDGMTIAGLEALLNKQQQGDVESRPEDVFDEHSLGEEYVRALQVWLSGRGESIDEGRSDESSTSLASRLAARGIESVTPYATFFARFTYGESVVDDEVRALHCIGSRLTGSLDLDILRRAWASAIGRHDALRSEILPRENGELLYLTHKQAEAELKYVDARGRDPWEVIEELRSPALSRHKPGLFRPFVVQTGEQEYWHCVNWNHAIMDYWTHTLVEHDICEAYNAYVEGRELEDGRPARHLNCQSLYRELVAPPDARDYFEKDFRGFDCDKSLAAIRTKDVTAVDRIFFCPDETERESMRRIRQSFEFTPNALVQAAWTILTAKITGSDDLVTAHLVNDRFCVGRGFETTGPLIGLSLSRLLVDPGKSPVDLMAAIQKSVSAGLRYRGVSWEDVFDACGFTKVPFIARFSYNATPRSHRLELAGLERDRPFVTVDRVGTEMMLFCVEGPTTLYMESHSRLEGENVANLAQRCARTLKMMLADIERPIGTILDSDA